MKGLLITLLGLALFAGGLFNIQNDFYGYSCCFLGGFLIGIGINETIKTKKWN
jgi:hypothetical protein